MIAVEQHGELMSDDGAGGALIRAPGPRKKFGNGDGQVHVADDFDLKVAREEILLIFRLNRDGNAGNHIVRNPV
jgi:hypothetical protein